MSDSARRAACVADQFYPGDPGLLRNIVEGYLRNGPKRERAVAVVSPHAGYIYSGKVAGEVFSRVKVPDNVILIGPNHTGLGEKVSLMPSGEWDMPLGTVVVNEELSGMLLDKCGLFSPDRAAHMMEHSLEVQLPFIYCVNPGARIVPITVMHLDFGACDELGRAIADVVTGYGEEVLIVVSSDMNHYESDKVTRRKDKLAIDRVLLLDAKGLLEVTGRENITMCGVVPAAMAICASRMLRAKGAELIDHTTSADTSGDYSQVVGYAGIVIR